MPGATLELQAEDPTNRRIAQAAGLRHRSVRQEPSGRIGMNFCRPHMASTNSSATCTT
jgi:hypothetical protein